MSDRIKMQQNFEEMIPRSIFAEANPEKLDKTGQTFTGQTGMGYNPMLFATMGGMSGGSNILRSPNRRYYDPELTTTAIYLPRNIRQKNRWCRWFFDHDALVGAVLELHAELPYSRAEILMDDPLIKQAIEDCLDQTNFFSMLPLIDLEFMKIGEVFINTPWDSAKGMWSHIIIHNPDFVEVRATPFADNECIIEIKPGDELRKIIHSTKPEDQQLKKRLPKEIVKRVLTGKNILLDTNEVTHIARRSNPYDIRGTSLVNRLFRDMMYEDKLREAQQVIADNFIYPLKLFKLGDAQKGWIPSSDHQQALAQMLQNAQFDPNFSLIYHYGLQVEYITVADKVMKLDKEFDQIAERKMIALGVSKEFMAGSSNYASANVGLQIQLARYKAKRDLFEVRWMMDKFFRIMAERNEWYKRDAKEIVGHYRVERNAEEKRRRLMMPKLMWHKKLMMRDDQQFLTFLHNVYAQGKGPVSVLTLLMHMGLDLTDELRNKSRQKEMEVMVGQYSQTPAASAPTPAPGLGPIAKLKDKWERFKSGDKAKTPIADDIVREALKLAEEYTELAPIRKEFIANATFSPTVIPGIEALSRERVGESDLTNNLLPTNNDEWHKNIKSANISSEVVFALSAYDNKLSALTKKYNGEFSNGVVENSSDLLKSLVDIYVQGKLTAYNWTDFLPIYKQHYAMNEDLRDYSDIVLSGEFEDWITDLTKMSMVKEKLYRHLRDLSNTCYCFGQLKGFQEQGIVSVKVSNVQDTDGLRYKIDELTQKGKNLASIISPNGEVALFSPCIEGFDNSELGNTIDTRIKRYRDASISGIQVKDCPVEYMPFVERFVNKLGKYLKKAYDNVIFVKDVIDLPEWEDTQRRRAEEENKDAKPEIRPLLVANRLLQERTAKMGKVPVFKQGKTLYISNWIGMEDIPLTENFIKYIKLGDTGLENYIQKNFKSPNMNLTQEELNTYRVLGYINPLTNSLNEIIGWEATSKTKTASEIDDRITIGKAWDNNGRCTLSKVIDPIQLFEANLRYYIDYPHKLGTTLLKAFENI